MWRFLIFCILCLWPTLGYTAIQEVLSSKDVQNYQKIFELYRKGDYQKADRLFQQTDNKILEGYVLYGKYFSPYYKTKKQEITNWFKRYSDLPVASDMYALGKQKKASLPKSRPKEIFGGKSKTCSYVPREDPIDLLPKRTFSYWGQANRIKAQKQMRQIMRYLQRGKTLNAKQLIQSKEVQSLFRKSDLAAARTALAFSYFLDGEDKQALEQAQRAIDLAGDEFPQASWTAGLVSWRLGNTSDAATYFISVVNNKKTLPLMRAGSAFWAARSLLKSGQFEKVGDYLEVASQHPRTFYGIIALRLLGQDLGHAWDIPEQPQEDDVDISLSHPALTRFYALRQVGKNDWARRELTKLYLEADRETQGVLLMISEENGFSDDLMGVVGSLDGDDERFPAPNWCPIDGWKLDRSLVYAFVRQESCFNRRAKSSVGALGLMQIMPQTGRELCRILGYPWSVRKMQEPEFNLSLGQNYLLRLMALPEINNNLIFTAVAYNAGPGNLSKWKKKMNFQEDPLLFIESIPSKETRSFVERIMVNYWIYRSLMGESLSTLDDVASGQFPIHSN